ncbi:hypothetical protein AB0M28_21460 [Streptomyces sp. NPDC051940]|uniref:hypothetical protein n=1 Tax=Streptomyces sp. NPDC051940 TaxID=3155675 RepID=UPI0034239794
MIAVVVVVLAVGLGEWAEDPEKKEHPPSADVKITSCTVDPATRWPSAGLEIRNHSSEASTYFVTVEFTVPDGTRLSEGVTGSLTVAPGQTVRTSVIGPDEVPENVACKVVDVDRYAG